MVSNHSAVGVGWIPGIGDNLGGEKKRRGRSPEPMTSIRNALQIGYQFK